MPDALIQAQPELGICFVPFDRVVWSFTGGALIQQALENYLAVGDLGRSRARRGRESAKKRVGRIHSDRSSYRDVGARAHQTLQPGPVPRSGRGLTVPPSRQQSSA